MKTSIRAIFLALAVSFVVTSANAGSSIIVTNSEVPGSQTGIPADLNLLTQGQPTLGSLSQSGYTAWSGGAGDINVLNDNATGAYTLSIPNASWTLTTSLNTTLNPLGYNITEIKTISGWYADYVDQNYTLSYSTVSAPGTFISLGSFSLNTSLDPSHTDPSDNPTSLAIDLTGSSGGFIATNVAALQFQFVPAADSYGHTAAYREVEVFGVQNVPEPSMAGFIGLGLAALGYRESRRKSPKPDA